MSSDLKDKYAREGMKASLEAKRDRLKNQSEELDAVLDPELNPDGASQAEEGSEWTELRKYIGIHFSEAKDHPNLSANQIMVGVANVLGWQPAKIAKESGIKKRTIHSWLSKTDVQYLIKEFQIKKGQEDPREMMTAAGYKGLKFIDHLLSLSPSIANKDLLRLQLDAAKFQVQQSYGKAEEHLNVKGNVSYKDIAEQVYKSNAEDLTEEEEEELFN